MNKALVALTALLFPTTLLAQPGPARQGPPETPLSDHWRHALETVYADNVRLGTSWNMNDASARARGLQDGFLRPVARALDGQPEPIDERVEFQVGHHPDARRKDPNDPRSPLVISEHRTTATTSGAVAFLGHLSQGLQPPYGLDTQPDSPTARAFSGFSQAIAQRPPDPALGTEGVSRYAHEQLVEQLSLQATRVSGPEAYRPGPDGKYSREDLLRMAQGRHFLAQVRGQLWKTSFSNYLSDAELIHQIRLTDAQKQRFEAAGRVEAALNRALTRAGVLDFENGRYVPQALPPPTQAAPPVRRPAPRKPETRRPDARRRPVVPRGPGIYGVGPAS